jgi:hypothetical protein
MKQHRVSEKWGKGIAGIVLFRASSVILMKQHRVSEKLGKGIAGKWVLV